VGGRCNTRPVTVGLTDTNTRTTFRSCPLRSTKKKLYDAANDTDKKDHSLNYRISVAF